jgi:hypothetical protein
VYRRTGSILAGATAGALAVTATLATSHAATAATAILYPAADATLVEDATGALANGSGTNLFVGRVGSNAGETLRRGLIRFDLSSIPAGSTVQAASVTLYLTRSRQAGDLPVALHRVDASWTEGTSSSSQGNGDASVNGDVTWIHRTKPGVAWSTPGGDFQATPSATQTVSATGGPKSWASTPLLVADVQGWITSPATNHGWIIVGFEAGSTSAKGFATRESAFATDRPRLEITYTPPDPPPTRQVPLPVWALGLLAAGLAGFSPRNRRR